MHKEEFKALSAKIADGNATDEEIACFNSYYDALMAAGGEVKAWPDEGALLERIRRKTAPARTVSFGWPKVAAAAAVALAIAAGYWMFAGKDRAPIAKVSAERQHILPGGNSAYLTLADGRRISLDDAKPGDVASQGNIRITKTDKGEVVYEAAPGKEGADGKPVWNELTTPRGGQFRLLLPDGTKVWLNAASALRFPAAFSGNERRVELTGEGYFEVAADKLKPFIVQSPAQQVKVLGTHFNLQAYTDEPFIKTSLLEGSVEVTVGKGVAKLAPGQQSSLNSQTGELKSGPADVAAAAAWKNGFFVFNDTYLSDVIRQLSRWYDVKADFSRLPRIRYTGTIPRNVPLDKALEMLEITGNVQFDISQNTIHVK